MQGGRIAVCALAALACHGPLVMPPAPGAPQVSGVSPERVFAGEWVTVLGSGFHAAPAANQVFFGEGASAPADEVVGGALRLRVPAGAGSGAVVVQTPAGRSAPGGRFEYAGRGHPAGGALASLVNPGLRPLDVATAGGEVYVLSEALEAVLGTRGTRLAYGGNATYGLSALGDGRLLLLTTSGLGVLPEGATDAAQLELVDLGLWVMLVQPVERDGRCIVQAVAATDEGGARLVEIDFGTQPPRAGPARVIPLSSVWAVSATPDGGRFAAIGRLQGGDDSAVGYAVWIREGTTGQERLVPLPADVTATSALAIAGGRLYTFFSNRRIGVLDLAAPTAWTTLQPFVGPLPWLLWAVETGGGPALLGLFPDTGQVSALGLDGRALWGVDIGRAPVAAAIDRARGYVVVFDADTDSVHVVDYASGRNLGRIVMDMGLGDDGGGWQGLALDERRHRLLAVAQRWRALAAVDTRTLQPAPAVALRADTTLPRAVGVDPRGQVWVLHEDELGRLEGTDGGGPGEEIVVEELPARGKWLAFAEGGVVVVGMLDRLAVWRPPDGPLRSAPPLPGLLDYVEVEPAGTVLAVWTREASTLGDVSGAARWTLEALEAGDEPLARMPELEGARIPLGVLPRPDGVQLFFANDGDPDIDRPIAIRVGRDLQPSRPEPSPVSSMGPFAATPDDRRFFWGDYNSASVLHYLEHTDAGGVQTVSAQPLSGQLRGIAVDGRGERTWVLLGGSNRVAVFQ